MEARKILIYLSIICNGDWRRIYEHIAEKKTIFPDEDINNALSKMKCKAVTLLDKEYPTQLKRISQPPFVLFYYGDISLIQDNNKIISVVGSRNATKYGIKHTDKIVKELCKKAVIVSGMALGIDTCAHNACVYNKGKTVAVLGTGIDNCYPMSNLDLYKELKKNHLVISEYYNNEYNIKSFPFRNRIIAGLCKGLLVGEAYEKSGTSITVTCALQNGIEVCAIPYPIDSHSHCNELIKTGACLVENANDVLYFFNMED